jgi:CBS domain-containing protein
MITVQSILKSKGQTVHHVSPDASVFAALEAMARHNVGALVVIDGDRAIGMISERDYARKVILVGKVSKDTPVRDIMTTHVVHVPPDASVEACMGLMTERRFRHLVVREGERLLGVISIGDVVKAVIDEQKFTIEQLGSYIAGNV